ncbi:porin [Roseibium denhamense]|uniref:Porin n=1 Tax=Roseibium denhamense TaxID=76305 RepID=A0ABY1P293_9HYPH|nr:porin [Roseibium denhamense]MTI07694.1 porin [Roseibium denhamense]SMP24713.1 Porin subfamily protein [Roseibium denhamense]
MKHLSALCAATCVATAALPANAADLPIAPEPVDYVRVCDAYGKRFFYIPGTETCLRIRGRVRTEIRIRNFGEAENAWGDRDTDGYQWRTRGYIYLDARTETEFGTLRAYTELYQQANNGTESDSLEKAYIQWGGLLAGYNSSNFDFFTGYAMDAQIESYSDQTINQLAYTLTFGHGLSATVALEDRSSRETNIGLNGATLAYGGTRAPDVVAALGINQSWGQAQIMGALHQVYPNAQFNASTGSDEDKLGWAVGAGAEFDFDALGGGTSVAVQVVYTDGASGYGSTGWVGQITDAVWDGNSTETTKTFNIFGGVSQTINDFTLAVEGGYHDVDAGTDAFDFTQWSITGNAMWEPVDGFEMGPEVQYRDIDYNTASGLDDTYEVYGTFRIQRSF